MGRVNGRVTLKMEAHQCPLTILFCTCSRKKVALVVSICSLITILTVWNGLQDTGVNIGSMWYAQLIDGSTNIISQLEVPRQVQYFYRSTLRPRLPQCIIIGAKNCGSESLAHFLAFHKGIISAPNDINFFGSPKLFMNGFEWYRQRMPMSYSGQVTLDYSERYFDDEKVAKNILFMNHSIKLIVIVRNPVERALDEYFAERSAGKVAFNQTFANTVMNATTGTVDKESLILKHSLYHVYLSHWLSFFHWEQILVVDGDQMANKPWIVGQNIETFLGLYPLFSEAWCSLYHSKRECCVNLDTQSRHGRCVNFSQNTSQMKVGISVIEELQQYFKPHNEIFQNLVGYNFTWD